MGYFNYAPLISHLKEIIKADPKPEDQTDQARAFHVLTRLIANLDKEQATRPVLPQPAGYYAFLHVESQVEFIVEEQDIQAFARAKGLGPVELLKVGNGEQRETRGYVRGKHIKGRGKAFKPAVPIPPKSKKPVAPPPPPYKLPPIATTRKFVPNTESE